MKINIVHLLQMGAIVSMVLCSSCDTGTDAGVRTPPPNETGTFTDSRDGKEYNWVKIGDQVWMADNLAFKVDTGGCWAYNNDDTNVPFQGYLYNWITAKAVAPDGWHLPSNDEWGELKVYLEENGYSYDGNVSHDYIGKSLATDTGWEISDVEGSVGNPDYPEYRNASGFSAIPSGARYEDGTFSGLGEFTYYWSSTAIGASSVVYSRLISYNMRFNQVSSSAMSQAFPARYIKD